MLTTRPAGLPPGQREIDEFPRFGLPKYAHRYRAQVDPLALNVGGDVHQPLAVSGERFAALPRTRQTSDFHCVTTWTRCGLVWGGVRFRDFYELLVRPDARPLAGADWVVFRCRDGFRACLPLADLMADDVLLADELADAPLTAAHGAPLRLVAPAHYGYKSAKHLNAIEFHRDPVVHRPPGLRFMDHPRARVALEERGRGAPAWLLRWGYRPFIGLLIRRFRRAMK